VAHDDPAGVTGQALRRFRGNADAVVEDRLAWVIGVCQHRGIDVDHHLVARPGGARVEAVMERRLGEQRQGVGLLLLHRGLLLHGNRRFRGNVRGLCRPRASAVVQRLPGSVERRDEQRPDLGRQATPDRDRAVFILIHVQGAELVLELGIAELGLAVHPAPAAHDALDVLSGARAPDGQQALLDVGRGDAGEGPDLGVGQRAAGERLGQPGQTPEGTRHADLLPGGAEVKAGAPG